MQSACLLLLIGLVSCRTAPLPRDDVANAELRKQLIAVVERDGLRAALDSLQSAAAADSSVLRNAHQLAHDIGRAALERAGSPSVIVHCRPVFSSGCYHGVVEAYVQRRGAAEMTELERMCAEAGGPDTPGPVSECVHGLGHGVLGAMALDLERTLRLCDALSSADRRGACHSGAFMEAVMAALHEQTPHPEGTHDHAAHEHHAGGSRRLTIDASDPFSPCARFDDPYAKACWIYQGFLILREAGFDARGALERCRQAPAPRVAQCAQSIGFQITGLFQRDDQWIISQCGRAVALSSECAAGASAALSSMDWSGGRAARFCAAAPAAWQPACVASAGRTLHHLARPGDLQRFWQRAVAGRAAVAH